MFGGQVVLIILNAWCLKNVFVWLWKHDGKQLWVHEVFVATLCLVGFCKITFKLDSYMAALGVNLGRPSPRHGSTRSSHGGTANFFTGRKGIFLEQMEAEMVLEALRIWGNLGSANGFTEPTGPIPMNPSGGSEVDIESLFQSGDFDTEYPEKHETAAGDTKSMNASNTASANVLDELGIRANGTETSGTSYSFWDN